MPKNSNDITGLLKGGLGNQLFILAATWAQAERLDCKFNLDVTFFGTQSLRQLEIGSIKPSRFNDFVANQNLKDKIQSGLRITKQFKETTFEFDSRILEITKGTVIDGYFQSEKYFRGLEPKLSEAMIASSANLLPEKFSKKFKTGNFLAAHVRRGDYLTNREANEVHGLATPGYFERAIETMRQLTQIEKVLVFSDDLSSAKQELGHVAGVIFDDELEELEALPTMFLMSQAAGIATSNSTFSWWAAWLNSQQFANSTVIAPRPWFKNGPSTIDLIPPNWLTLGN